MLTVRNYTLFSFNESNSVIVSTLKIGKNSYENGGFSTLLLAYMVHIFRVINVILIDVVILFKFLPFTISIEHVTFKSAGAKKGFAPAKMNFAGAKTRFAGAKKISVDAKQDLQVQKRDLQVQKQDLHLHKGILQVQKRDLQVQKKDLQVQK